MRFRFARDEDLPTCREFLDPRLHLSTRVLENLIPLWQSLLADETCIFTVVEDPARSHPHSLEGFGASVFVNDAFMEAVAGSPRPYVAAAFYEALLAGHSPILTPAASRTANAQGTLNLLVLHYGLRDPDMRAPRTLQVLQCGSASFYSTHAGYHIRRLLNEVFGQMQVDYMAAGGFRLRKAFDGPSSDEGLDLRPEHRPHLFGLSRDEVPQGAINPLSFLFHAPAPILGLSRSEQRVLTRALLNESDPEVARALGISPDAVKKSWTRIYQRVSGIAPYLLGPDSLAAGNRRSLEKRRHLLEYLRTHPEELRPYQSAPRVPGSAPPPTTLAP